MLATYVTGCLLICAISPPTEEGVVAVGPSVLARYFESIRNRIPASPPDLHSLTSDSLRSIGLLAPYLNSESKSVRWHAASLICKVGESSEDATIRRDVTERLAELCSDKNAGQSVTRWLLRFQEKDFSQAAKTLLAEEILRGNPDRSLVFLIGTAGIHELADLLRDRAAGGSLDAMFALTRLGDDSQIDEAIRRVDTDTNRIARATRRLEQLAYTRHPKAYRFIGSFLDSDERLPLVKNGVPGTRVAQRAMDVLVRLVPDAPLPTGRTPRYNYTPEEISLVREWVRESF